jgi:dephospho-CoA kinase
MLRNSLTPDEAQKRIDSQMSQEDKQRFAISIDTSDGFEPTRQRIKEVRPTRPVNAEAINELQDRISTPRNYTAGFD